MYPTAMSQVFNFSDIFKSSFLQDTASNFSITDTLLVMGISFLIGLLIYTIYRKTFTGVMYSRNFSLSLIALCMITSLVILGVTSNIVLSLGMVGALSIVRFRTAIKDPIDIVYLFWAIAAGIVTGAGLYVLALIGSVLLGIVLVVFATTKNGEDPYVLVATVHTSEAEEVLMEILSSNVKRMRTKCKAVYPDGRTELTIEVRLSGTTDFVRNMATIPDVDAVSLVSYSGDLAG